MLVMNTRFERISQAIDCELFLLAKLSIIDCLRKYLTFKLIQKKEKTINLTFTVSKTYRNLGHFHHNHMKHV